MKRIRVRTVDGQEVELSYDPAGAEGSRYAVDRRTVAQVPRRAGSTWELWVPHGDDDSYAIYTMADTELDRLREAQDLS